MKYETGEKVQVADLVAIEYGKTLGKVTAVIESKVQMEQFGVVEAGILILSKPFGLVFWPSSYSEDPVKFIDNDR